MRAVLALGLGLGIATATAAVAVDPAVLAEGAEAVAICANNMPDIHKTKSALNAAGFRLDDSNGEIHAYTRSGSRVVVGITTPSARRLGCLTVVDKMTPAEARTIMQPVIEATEATPIEMPDTYSFSHVASLEGGPVMISVVNLMDLEIVRGAAVIAVGLHKQ